MNSIRGAVDILNFRNLSLRAGCPKALKEAIAWREAQEAPYIESDEFGNQRDTRDEALIAEHERLYDNYLKAGQHRFRMMLVIERRRSAPRFTLPAILGNTRRRYVRVRTPRRVRCAVTTAPQGGGSDDGGDDGPEQSDPSNRLRAVFALGVMLYYPKTNNSRWPLRSCRNGSVRVLKYRTLAPLCAHGVAGPPVASHVFA